MPQTTIAEIMTMVTVTVMVTVTRSTIDRDRDRRDDNCTRASSRDQRTLANEAMIRGFRAIEIHTSAIADYLKPVC